MPTWLFGSLRGYHRDWLRGDLIAGMTVWAVLVPEALAYATQLHARQRRKASGIPYIAHLLGVTALVLEDGGDEDEAIAALLHDAVEDQGGLPTLDAIRERFGTVGGPCSGRRESRVIVVNRA